MNSMQVPYSCLQWWLFPFLPIAVSLACIFIIFSLKLACKGRGFFIKNNKWPKNILGFGASAFFDYRGRQLSEHPVIEPNRTRFAGLRRNINGSALSSETFVLLLFSQ